MRRLMIGLTSLLLQAASGGWSPASTEVVEVPYGTANFAAYQDINDLKQLKVVWDFNFVDPKAVGIVFNYVNALLTAVSEFGPHEIDPIKIVVVSHGPEVVVFARKNYAKYKDIVDGRQLSPNSASSSKSVAMPQRFSASPQRTCTVS